MRPGEGTKEGTHFVGGHAVLDEEGYPGVQIADIALQDKVLL